VDTRSEAPEALEPTERELRVQLAAAYRLVDRFQMTDLIFNHISVRVPGPEHHFLINPFGLLYSEVTASNLVKIDLDGNIIGDSPWRVNRAGFNIHSAIHMAREELRCVLHTHTRYSVAVSAMEEGLLPLHQGAMRFYNRLAYHDYEGVAQSPAERERLVRDLGDRRAMLLRNHGLLVMGGTVAEAFMAAYALEKACEVQVLAQSTGQPLIVPSPDVCELTAQQLSGGRTTQMAFDAYMRLLDREDPSYKD
jgi:ribulose-5-phosphate 4-epimerase/fuculose-1-phosphate aldolase